MSIQVVLLKVTQSHILTFLESVNVTVTFKVMSRYSTYVGQLLLQALCLEWQTLCTFDEK